MQKKRLTRWLSFALCMVLIAAMALCMTGCNNNTQTADGQTDQTTGDTSKATVLGDGKTTFSFTVTDSEGKESAYEIHTDKTTVGDALLELKLIAGEESSYGLYVKTVNGITLDYDKDGKYWAFYIDGEYAMTGVDATKITEGATYAFKPE